MIIDGKKCHDVAVKSWSRLLGEIKSTNNDSHYWINYLRSLRTESRLKSYENVWKNHNYSNAEMPESYYNQECFTWQVQAQFVCSIALTLLLIVVFWFPNLISIIYDSKEIVQFKYQC